jgi:hypothetical protein
MRNVEPPGAAPAGPAAHPAATAERRAASRDPCHAVVTVHPAGTVVARPAYSVVLLDVSDAAGVGLGSARAMVRGARFKLKLDLGGGGGAAGGVLAPRFRVRNHQQAADGPFKVGAEFTGEVDPGARAWAAADVADALRRLRRLRRGGGGGGGGRR